MLERYAWEARNPYRLDHVRRYTGRRPPFYIGFIQVNLRYPFLRNRRQR